MSTPITFSGFNNIDFNAVVNGLMQQASQPLNSLQTQQKTLQSRITNFDALASRLAAVRSAAAALDTPSDLTMVSGTSSDAQAVSVGTDSTALPGEYDVVVTELARAQVTVSASTAPDPNTTVMASGGTLTIGGVTVTLSGDTTLQQLASAINATDGIGVRATVIRTSDATYRLALTGTLTGEDNAFTVVNALTGGAGVSFTDTDFDGVSGDSAADNAVVATDAALLVNNIAVTGSSNVFTDLVPGVSLTALRKDPSAVVRIEVGADSSALKSKVQAFVTAYNALVTFIGEQRSASAGGNGAAIGRDPMLRQLHGGLRGILTGAHGSGSLTRLAEVGVEFQSSGQLKLNDQAFDDAVTTDADGVQDLFAGAAGAFVEVGSLVNGYAQADGVIPAGKKRLESQINLMDAQIEAMQRRLAIERESLLRQFAEADAVMSRLNSQAGSLSQLGSAFKSDLSS